ncbi:AraC family transcriptional regulator [Bradyrhizobium prioriisuperbiae]|uniref:AraC family transcriptional regulator n=1 Tax=Bradyrhizobium prioriisuperbiae TaxID=2854389 RepID=UPI0028EC46D4|nr:AraC family transcriptional regulator [Bradyrhizobium prioritasuperba]
MTLATIDLALRVGTTALLLLLAMVLLRDVGHTTAGRLAAAFALGSAAYALSSAAGFAEPVTWSRGLLIALSTGNVVVFWLFARALFDDGFVVRGWHAAAWAAMVSLSILNCAVLAPDHGPGNRILGPALTLAALTFIVLAVGQSVASWSADLVEGRRRLRVFIVAATAIYGGINTALQLLPASDPPSMLFSTINALALAGIVAVITVSMMRAAGDDVFVTPTPARHAGPPPDEPAHVTDRKLADALARLMSEERIYRQEGVTIGLLATRLSVPEYKVRRLINQQLGYRNFNVFLNNYRIEEAKAALADPAQAAVPVTTIALDAGFQSLGPFNRAFKTETGVTPTEYRRARTSAA